MVTMAAFWDGEARQTSTQSHRAPRDAKALLRESSERTTASVLPSMTSSRSRPSVEAPALAFPSLRSSRWPCTIDLSLSLPVSLRTMSLSWSLISLHAIPMLMAVSCLSPVITQTLIRASLRIWMDSGTSSWSLSSTAVIPKK